MGVTPGQAAAVEMVEMAEEAAASHPVLGMAAKVEMAEMEGDAAVMVEPADTDRVTVAAVVTAETPPARPEMPAMAVTEAKAA